MLEMLTVLTDVCGVCMSVCLSRSGACSVRCVLCVESFSAALVKVDLLFLGDVRERLFTSFSCTSPIKLRIVG